MSTRLEQVIKSSKLLSDEEQSDFLQALLELSEEQQQEISNVLEASPEYTGVLYDNYLKKKQNKHDPKAWEAIIEEEVEMLMDAGEVADSR